MTQVLKIQTLLIAFSVLSGVSSFAQTQVEKQYSVDIELYKTEISHSEYRAQAKNADWVKEQKNCDAAAQVYLPTIMAWVEKSGLNLRWYEKDPTDPAFVPFVPVAITSSLKASAKVFHDYGTCVATIRSRDLNFGFIVASKEFDQSKNFADCEEDYNDANSNPAVISTQKTTSKKFPLLNVCKVETITLSL